MLIKTHRKELLLKINLKKIFYMLMNNSVFGKTMENICKRVDVKLITDENKLLKYSSKSTFVSSKIVNDNLVAIQKLKEYVILKTSAYLSLKDNY